jgi:Ca2+-binding RTX toxin-like protein
MPSFTPDLDPANPNNSDNFLFGTQDADTISGLNGADTIYGLGAGDLLNGDAQDDDLHGGTGDDSLFGGTGDDTLHGEDGGDILEGGPNDDILFGGGEDDSLNGGTGFDHMSGGGENDAFLWVNGDGNDINDGGSGEDIQNIFGSETEGDIFSLDPNDAQTTLVFQRENLVPFNLQLSNMEAVEIFTGGGDDFFETGDLAGTGLTELFVDGGDGSDTISTQANEGSNFVVAFGGADADFFFGGNGDEDFIGEEGGDHFFSGAGDDFLEGDAGNDQMFSGSGNDIVDGGDGNDTIVTGPGDDSISTGDGSDQIRYDLSPVAGGNDTIDDFSFADTLFLGGITQAQLDSNGDTVIDDDDALVSFDAVSDSLLLDFNATDSLTLLGVSSLSIGPDVTFV